MSLARSSAAPMSWASGSSRPAPAAGAAPATSQLDDLQNASSALREKINKDASMVPDLGDLLAIPGRPTSSTYSIFPDDYRTPFQKRRLLGIPEEVFRFYQTTQHSSHMGFLPEIERVWISVDHQLILWDYVEGQELNTYAEQPEVITHVALVKPKPGVFIDDIQHLLVICTPVSVLLLGIQQVPGTTSTGRSKTDLKVYATGMSVPTEVQMNSVAGTADGRIFLSGAQDGNLYELHYQEKEGWFGKRVQLINHSVGGVQSLLPKFSASASSDQVTQLVSDIERGCFYALSEAGVISVYKTNGEKAIQLVQRLANIFQSAQDKAPGNPAIHPSNFKLYGLQVVRSSESRNGISLVAITSSGVRLYFAFAAAGYAYSYGSSSGSNGRTLQLVHLRLPPTKLLHPDDQARANPAGPAGMNGASASSGPFPLSDLDNVCYDLGVTLATQPGDSETRDFLLCLSPDITRVGTLGQVEKPPAEPPLYANGAAGPQKPPLAEYASLLAIPGRTWAMAAVRHSASTPASAFQELATQFSEPSRQFMILTSAGITFLAKRRPLDYLKDVIEEYHAEGTVQSILHFRDSFGRDQTCAMLLGLACGNTFLELGDVPAVGNISTIGAQLADVAKQAFYDFGERPIFAERMTFGTGDGAAGTTMYSGRREGFAFYLARLVRPVWEAKITKPGPLGVQQLNVSDALLEGIQKNLHALKDFLDQNPQLFHSSPGDHAGARSAAASEQDAWRFEQQSVMQLQALLSRTIEAISFILLLHDHRMGEIIARCDAEVQKQIASLTFEQLVTAESGVSVSRALVNILIDDQIGQQVGVDAVSEVLQSRCGSFCSTDDVMLYKAKENIRRAFESNNPASTQESLAESLRLYVKGSRILDFERLREIVGDYQHLQYAKGAIELPLHCAQVEDADNQGRNWWLDGCPAADPRAQAWERRGRCYDLVLDSLSAFDGPGTQANASEQARATRTFAYELALSADDEVFHSTLYDWLLDRGLADELLEMRPAYLEAHLRREPVTARKLQLLWQFYVKAGQPLQAAEVLGALARSTTFDLSLEKRIEYLTRAISNAKSCGGSGDGLALITDLEEELDVAQIQLEAYHTLLPRLGEGGIVTGRIELLQQRLLVISDLYHHYAIPFALPAIKLAILATSNTHDEPLVREIWNEIFSDAMEGVEGAAAAAQLASKIVPLGHRFHESESAFPLRHVASTLVRFSLANKDDVPHGWAPRVLVQCNVPRIEVWDILNEMYESQIPPFNQQANVQAISSDIAVLLSDWVAEAARAPSRAAREFPVGRVSAAVTQYIRELDKGRTETRALYEDIQRELRQWA